MSLPPTRIAQKARKALILLLTARNLRARIVVVTFLRSERYIDTGPDRERRHARGKDVSVMT
jgi:hypothetical protein